MSIDKTSSHNCCFFGHRNIEETEELRNVLYNIIEDLIENKKVNTFLFGSKSEFDDICLKTVTELKEKYPHIRRIYVRAEYPYIDDSYKKYLLKRYDDTFYPEHMKNAGKASYVERNFEMIDKSKYCVICFDKNYISPRRKNGKRDLSVYQPKSGTKIAHEYAIKKGLTIINVMKNERKFTIEI